MCDSEEDLKDSLEAAMEKYPDSYAILVRKHGMYVDRSPFVSGLSNGTVAMFGETIGTRRKRNAKGKLTTREQE